MTANAAKPMTVYWVEAFTQVAFSGNPAGVVTQADGLTETQMQQIAREVNCSETAFLTQPSHAEADLRLRWFTPTTEVDLCGHATVAAMHVLANEGRFSLKVGATQILYVETRSGILAVTVDYTNPEGPWIWLTLPTCQFQPLSAAIAEKLHSLLGLSSTVDNRAPVIDSLNQDVLVAVESLAQLHSLKPNFTELAALGTNQGWRGICAYTTQTLDPRSAAHSRFFAPQYGILEDPVTGSVSGPLALYLQQSQQLKPLALTQPLLGGLSVDQDNTNSLRITLEQGDCLGRQGRVVIDLTSSHPKLGGQAIIVMRGELYL